MPCPLPGKGNNKMAQNGGSKWLKMARAQNGDTHNSWQVYLT
jgi:hypothetical protein